MLRKKEIFMSTAKSPLYIGNHTTSSKGYTRMARQMIANGGNTFAFFTRNPRGGKAKDIDPQDVQAFLQLAEENHFGKLVAHAPYTMNACAAKENLRDFAREKRLDYTLLLALLRQLDFERVLFDKDMELYSEGQKKKVLIASSLLTPAHLYIWDEPLNYIDVYTRMQIEKLLLAFRPTMLFVEHDVRFKETIATGVLHMERN